MNNFINDYYQNTLILTLIYILNIIINIYVNILLSCAILRYSFYLNVSVSSEFYTMDLKSTSTSKRTGESTGSDTNEVRPKRKKLMDGFKTQPPVPSGSARFLLF